MAPKSANEEEIRAVFAPYGTLREIHVIRNQDGTNKGCAFVKYTTRQSALDAIDALHEQYTMQGGPRPLVVKFADNKRPSAARGPSIIGSPGRSGSGSHPDAPGWMGHPAGAGGYPYPMPAPPMSSSHMMGGIPTYNMPYAQGAAASGAPPQGSFVYYPYPPPGSYPSQGSYHSGPPSPIPRSGGGYGGVGHLHSPPARDGRHRQRPFYEDDVGSGVLSRPAEGPPGANLFIYHLPQDLSDADLATAFAPFGHVLSAKVYIDRASGESKGFGKNLLDCCQSWPEMGNRCNSQSRDPLHPRSSQQLQNTSSSISSLSVCMHRFLIIHSPLVCNPVMPTVQFPSRGDVILSRVCVL